jgi:predicted MPP superfamily phosphohydrolase
MKLPHLSRRAWLRLGLLAAPAAALVDAFWLEPRWLKVCRLRLAAARPEHRFVHFSDLHHKGNRSRLESVVAKVNRLAPDFACFTGDLVEDAAFLRETLEVLSGLRCPTFGVPGNHDYWATVDFDEVAAAFARTGGAWLMDQARLIRDRRVHLLGLTCQKPFAMKPEPGAKSIVLLHYPGWVTNLAPHKFDLILAGHSHGGQVRLPFVGALVSPAGVDGYEVGSYQTAHGPLYVNAGIGEFYLNVRFACRPELSLIEL